MAEHEAKDIEKRGKAVHSRQAEAVSGQPERCIDAGICTLGQIMAGMPVMEQAFMVGSSRVLPAQRRDAVIGLQQTRGNGYVQRLAETAEETIPDRDIINRIKMERNSGKSLDANTRARMETAFGYNFSRVTIHDDAKADNLSRDLDAHAFTTGNDVFFRQGSYKPDSRSGTELLAHELAHVVQQSGNLSVFPQRVTRPDEEVEREAESVSKAVLNDTVNTSSSLEPGVVAREASVTEAPGEWGEFSRGREAGVVGTDPIGHASGWAYMLTSEMVLYQQGQYDSESGIPYDAVRCGAAAILGAAIANGTAGLTTFIERLKARVESDDARESEELSLSSQVEKMREIHSNWNFAPGPGWNEATTDIVDEHPFTFDDLSWLQAIAYVQYIGAGAAGEGMVSGEVQEAAGELAQAEVTPVSPPPHYRIPMNANQLRQTVVHNNNEVADRFISPGAPARLQPGQSVILNVMIFEEDEHHNWMRNAHAITLSNINGTFHAYNPEATPIAQFVVRYLPEIYRGLPMDNLMGRHLAESAADTTQGIFGLLIGLVTEELTAPFQF